MNNIVITGFMGTGKTSVGRAVADKLKLEFVDMDAVIVERQGMEINEIFAAHGEPFFRQLERDLCAELAAQENLVIATGGGALTFPENRAVMGKSAILICLSASVEEIMRRLDAASDRPLLHVADRRAKIESLLVARRAAYAAIPHQIDTTGLSVEKVVARVEEICRFANLPIC